MKSTRSPGLSNQNNPSVLAPSKNHFIRSATTQYDIVDEMSPGANGLVYLVKNLSKNKLLIAKKQKFNLKGMSLADQQNLSNEEMILKSLNRLEEVEWLNPSEKLIVQTYFPGISLKHLSEKQTLVPQEHRLDIMNKVFDKLYAIHQLGWIHADLQPSNIIIDFDEKNNAITKVNEVDIVDFGHALALNNQNIVTIPMNSKLNSTYYGYYFYAYLKLPESSEGIPFSKYADFYAMGGMAQHVLVLSKNSLHKIWNHPAFNRDEEAFRAFKAGCEMPLFKPLLNKH